MISLESAEAYPLGELSNHVLPYVMVQSKIAAYVQVGLRRDAVSSAGVTDSFEGVVRVII